MPILDWEERRTSDDHGTADAPAVFETVWVAYDPEGLEWLVAPHDDGTFNWFRCAENGDPMTGETDHPTAESARAAAEARAVKLFRGRQ